MIAVRNRRDNSWERACPGLFQGVTSKIVLQWKSLRGFPYPTCQWKPTGCTRSFWLHQIVSRGKIHQCEYSVSSNIRTYRYPPESNGQCSPLGPHKGVALKRAVSPEGFHCYLYLLLFKRFRVLGEFVNTFLLKTKLNFVAYFWPTFLTVLRYFDQL